MSVEPCFLDTNVSVYLFDADSPAKQARSRVLPAEFADSAILSVQVLSEFYVAVTRKLERPLPTDQAQAAVDALYELQVRPLHSRRAIIGGGAKRGRGSDRG